MLLYSLQTKPSKMNWVTSILLCSSLLLCLQLSQAQVCPQDCQSCHNSTYCYVCSLHAHTAVNGVCMPCPDGCLNCQDVSYCNDCLYPDYVNVNGVCTTCPDGCLNCQDVSYCNDCLYPEYVNVNGVCTNDTSACPANCQSCPNSTYCYVCALYAHTAVNGVCLPCPHGCLNCQSVDYCNDCFYPDYVNVNGVCECSTPGGCGTTSTSSNPGFSVVGSSTTTSSFRTPEPTVIQMRISMQRSYKAIYNQLSHPETIMLTSNLTNLLDFIYREFRHYVRANITGYSQQSLGGTLVVHYELQFNASLSLTEKSKAASTVKSQANQNNGAILHGSETYHVISTMVISSDGSAVDITDACSLLNSINGCNSGSCKVTNGEVSCSCDSGYTGVYCNQPEATPSGTMGTSVVAPLCSVVSLLVASLLWNLHAAFQSV